MSNTPKTYTYRPTLGTGAIISSMAFALILAVDFLCNGYLNWYFRQYANIVHDEAALNQWGLQGDIITQIGDWLYYGGIITFIISVIFVAKWVYDSHCNARALGVENIAYSPLMSVGVLFIPIASLFMPFIAMRDMVNGSFEKANKPTFHWLILLWWTCFISGSLLSRFYNRKIDDLTTTLPEISTVAQLTSYFEQSATIIGMLQISSALLLISAISLIVIIKRTSHLHQQMHQQQLTQ